MTGQITQRRGRRWPAAAGIAAAAALALPSAGWAWTLELEDGTLRVDGSPGEANRLKIDDTEGGVSIADEAAPPPAEGDLPEGCQLDETDSKKVVCGEDVIQEVEVHGNELVDRLANDAASKTVALYGDDDNDTLTGGAADDALYGGPGQDTLNGDAGDDELDGGDGSDGLQGEAGEDRLDGGAGTDKLEGGDGDDALSAGEGTDSLGGDNGDDRVDGGGGHDKVAGGDGDDALSGGDGDDSLGGDDGSDRLDGGDGSDALTGSDGDDELGGGPGVDRLDGGEDLDVLRGGDGDDRLDASDGFDTAHGEAGNDRMAAGGDGASLDGGAGNDVLDGGDADDRVAGGAGNDRVNGGGGQDALGGGDGTDSLGGGDGDDALSGEGGDDALNGGDGADAFAGGPGTDLDDYSDLTAPVTVTIDGIANDGRRNERDNVGSDIERLRGGDGADSLNAGGALREINGQDDDDVLTGTPAAETLDGGAGDDRLRGGLGADVLIGARGTDVVTYDERRASVTVALGDGRPVAGQAGERDRVDPSVEDVAGGAGDDRLSGAPGIVNTLDGNAGRDVLVTRDRTRADDTLRCGENSDRAGASQADTVDDDCETVHVNGQPKQYGVAVRGRPSLVIAADALELDRRGRGELAATCGKEASTRCRGQVSLTRGGRRVARQSIDLPWGTERKLRVRVPRSAMGALLRRRGGADVAIRLSAPGEGTGGRFPLRFERR